MSAEIDKKRKYRMISRRFSLYSLPVISVVTFFLFVAPGFGELEGQPSDSQTGRQSGEGLMAVDTWIISPELMPKKLTYQHLSNSELQYSGIYENRITMPTIIEPANVEVADKPAVEIFFAMLSACVMSRECVNDR